MPIKFRRGGGGFVQVQIDIRNLFGHAARDVVGSRLGNVAGRFAENVAYELFDGMGADLQEPFTELPGSQCPSCRVPLYQSANRISACLQCKRRFSVGGSRSSFRVGANARHGGTKVRQATAHSPDRTFRVKLNRKGPASPPPPPPPTTIEIQTTQALRTLGLIHGATKIDIRKRRRALAREYHGDVGGDDKKMAEINAAADFLLEQIS